MKKLNKLGTMKQCPKCGMEQFKIKYAKIQTTDYVYSYEYMAVECQRCFYVEKELPLDAEE